MSERVSEELSGWNVVDLGEGYQDAVRQARPSATPCRLNTKGPVWSSAKSGLRHFSLG